MATPSILIVPDRYKSGVLYSQLPENGAVDFGVTRATPAFRTNASGVSESVASGVPRLDYPAAGGCPALLVEPAATNLLLRSEEFDDASWAKTNTTITANTTISPDGSQNADTMDVVDGNSRITQTLSLGAGTYTISAYVRVLSTTTAGQLRFAPVVDGSNVNSFFTVTSGWQRFTQTFTAVSGVTSVALRGAAGEFVGTIAVYGFQLETGSVATSYIPTTSAAVTRNADVISKTGVSGFIGQTEGTIYAEIDVQRLLGSVSRGILAISDGTVLNRVQFLFTAAAANTIRLILDNSNALTLSLALSTTGIYKLAVGYTQGGTASFFINGTQVGSDASIGSFTNALSVVEVGSAIGGTVQLNDRIRAAAIYTTRLSNTELAALTSL
jgi:hypothetical protein